LIGEFQLRITPPVASGYELMIYRATPRDLPLVDFTDGSQLPEVNLDIVARQSIFVAAESADWLGVSSTEDLTALATAAGNAAAAASASAGAPSGSASAASIASTAATAAATAAGASQSASAASSASAAASAVSAAASAASAGAAPALGAYDPAFAYAAASVGWGLQRPAVLLNAYPSVDTTGATNCTAAVQAIIDANKGKRIVFGHGGVFLLAGLILSGSSYDGTQLVIEGEVKMAPSPSITATNFQSAFWSGIVFHSTDRCGINITGNINGNRTAQPDYEFCHALVLAGVTNFTAPQIVIREVRGDGLYIAQALVTSSSANSRGISIGQIHVSNSADDGRNGVSIISGNDIMIGSLSSYKVGGVVGGVREPGGFDIEADHSYQNVDNVTIGAMVLVGAGTTMLGINGAGGFQNTTNVTIGSAVVQNTNAPNVTSELSGTPDSTNYYTLSIQNARAIRIAEFNGRFSAAFGDGITVQNCDDIRFSGRVDYTKIGAQLGNFTAVTNSEFDIRVSAVSRYGILTGNLTDVKISGIVDNLSSGKFSTKCAVVALRTGGVQTRVLYSVDVPYDANWTRTYRQDASFPVTFNDCRIANCALLGWGAPTAESWGDMPIPRVNVQGLNDASAIPTGGYAVRGDFIRNILPTLSAGKVTLGWTRLTSGTGHVLNTDWAAAVCPNA
jgi:hypothetical protein